MNQQGPEEREAFYLKLIENGSDMHTPHRQTRLSAGRPYYTYTGEGDLYHKELPSGDILLVERTWKGGFDFEERIVKQLRDGNPA